MGASKFIDAGGTTTDDDFEPWMAGDPTAADTGLLDDAGTDLAADYAPLSAGAALDHDTELLASGGGDLTAIFAAKGSRAGTALSATIPSAAHFYDYPPQDQAGGTIHCTVAGGTAPYTYAWTVVSGVACIVSGAATADVLVAYASAPAPGNESVLKCEVTDAAAGDVFSNNCTAHFIYQPGGGGA